MEAVRINFQPDGGRVSVGSVAGNGFHVAPCQQTVEILKYSSIGARSQSFLFRRRNIRGILIPDTAKFIASRPEFRDVNVARVTLSLATTRVPGTSRGVAQYPFLWMKISI